MGPRLGVEQSRVRFGVTVYLDLNSNGVQDPGEPFDVTDASGLYLIDGLGAGTYTARVNPATLPGGLAQTYDLDGIGTPNVAAGVIGNFGLAGEGVSAAGTIAGRRVP